MEEELNLDSNQNSESDSKPKLKQHVYYTQILPNVGQYNVCEIIVCTLYDTYFAGIDKHDKRRYIFNYSDIDKVIFYDRKTALYIVNDAERNKPKISNETYYEED